jgi:hypothetical protein
VRHGDVDMDAVALLSFLLLRPVWWPGDLLEPDRRPATVRVDEVVGALLPVVQHGLPERQHRACDELVDREVDLLDAGPP